MLTKNKKSPPETKLSPKEEPKTFDSPKYDSPVTRQKIQAHLLPRLADEVKEPLSLETTQHFGYRKTLPELTDVSLVSPEDLLRRIDLDIRAVARILVRLKVMQAEHSLSEVT